MKSIQVNEHRFVITKLPFPKKKSSINVFCQFGCEILTLNRKMLYKIMHQKKLINTYTYVLRTVACEERYEKYDKGVSIMVRD